MASATAEPSPPLSVYRKLKLLVEILAAYGRVRWLLWRRDLSATLAAVRDQEREMDAGGDPSPSADRDTLRLGHAVTRTLTLLPTDSRCLVRSLVLSALLARRNIDSSLIIAVRSRPEFAAHAWVECAGEPLLPPGEAAYERLLEI